MSLKGGVVMNRKYILDGKTPVPCDLMTWAKKFETSNRTVAKTEIGDVLISTVFLGLDHNWLAIGPPILFETMIFGGKLDQEQERYSTWEEAERGHQQMVAQCEKEQKGMGICQKGFISISRFLKKLRKKLVIS